MLVSEVGIEGPESPALPYCPPQELCQLPRAGLHRHVGIWPGQGGHSSHVQFVVLESAVSRVREYLMCRQLC